MDAVPSEDALTTYRTGNALRVKRGLTSYARHRRQAARAYTLKDALNTDSMCTSTLANCQLSASVETL